MIKLLALDLDGTLLDSQGDLSTENISAIRAAENLGVLVTIATGRRFRDARPPAMALGLNAPLVTHNGALVKYADSLETLAKTLLDTDISLEIVRVGKKLGGNALVSADPTGKGSLLYDTVSEENIPLLRYLEWSERLHGAEASQAILNVKDLETALKDHEVIHISFSGACAPMRKMLEFLRLELSDSVSILPTIYPHLDFTLIDILPPATSKATGIAAIAEAAGLGPENVMAIGDNFNDLAMLEYAGTPVVMGNADPDLLVRPEFYKTFTNNENGVAAAIRKFILD
jgi:Cof subfamily protein (haloacid dehalogenase superfamily)